MTTEAHAAIQCTAPSGKAGDFLFTGDIRDNPTLLTPVFSDPVEFYTYINKAGWIIKPVTLNPYTAPYVKVLA